ncbi:hypothetical protein A2V61_04060 [Candidatus Woesebacteria bacterium RBG_19FT_COMBO_47_8]|nr:MAG: hypothetical protein A2V61_04060 [Candidatus Woesebacteria bacterium RBG_19FT_COMBO_47_8]
MIKNLKEKVVSLWNKIANSIFFFFALVLFSTSALIYLGFGTSARAALIEQMLHREQVIARSGAHSIESFLNLFGISLNVLSNTTLTQENLDSFVDDWKETSITGVILTDREGATLANSTRSGESGVGVDLSDRDYFIWAKTAKKGEIYVSSPMLSRIGTSKGEYIILIATPIIKNDKFQGVLAGSVLLSELTWDYLDPLRISEATRIYLIDQDGVVLSSRVTRLIGVNYIDYLNSNPFLGSKAAAPTLKKALESKEEGKIDIVLQNENNLKLTRYLIAYTPVETDSGTRHWILAVATPINDALVFMGPIYARQMVAVIVAFLAVLALGIRLAKVIAYREASQKSSK